MSNFRIAQKPSFERTVNTSTLGSSRIQKAELGTTSSSTSASPLLNRSLSQTTSSVAPLPDLKQINQQIDSTNSKEIQKNSKEIPVRPAQLGPSALFLPELNTSTQKPLAPPQFSALLSDALQDAHMEVAKTMLQVGQNLDISMFLANNLLPSLQAVRAADSGLGRKAKIDHALDQSEQMAKNLIRNLGAQSDVSFVLKGKSQAELTALVTRSLQLMMGYSDQQMAKLSDKKKAWIARTVAGIQAGLVKQPPGNIKGQVAQALEQLEQVARQRFQELGNLHPVTIAAMTMAPRQMADQLETLIGKNPPEIMAAIQRGIEGAFGQVELDEYTCKVTRVRYQNTDFRVIKELGRGQCGTVMLIEGPEHKKYALKPLDANERAGNELQIQIHAAGEHALHVAGVIKQENQLFAMIELAPGGEMMDNLQFIKTALKDQHLSDTDAHKLHIRLGMGAAEALASFHSKGLIHRDIKEQNFFLTDGSKAKLGDMGEALPHANGYTEIIGTPDYMAPEVLQPDQHAGQPADNWALGIMLHQMLLGSHPFDASVPGYNDPTIATETANNGLRFAKGEPLQRIDGSTFHVDFENYPSPLNTLFQGLFHPDPAQRMRASEAAQLLRTMDDPQFNMESLMEASRNYGQNEKKIQEVISGILEKKMAEQYPQIPHIEQINRELGRYERAIKQYSDPIECQKQLGPNVSMERIAQLLDDAKKQLTLYQNHLQNYHRAKEVLMTQIMQMPEVMELMEKRTVLIQQLHA